MTDHDDLVLTERIRANPDEVFDHLVERDKLVRWMGVEAWIDPRPGGGFRCDVTGGDIARGEYIEIDRPRRVVFTWGWEGNDAIPPGSTTVTITLAPQGDHTLVELRHRGLPTALPEHEEGWRNILPRLEGAVSATRLRARLAEQPVVDKHVWETARQELLEKEKEHTRARDALAAQRRQMPWTPVRESYSFDGPDGPLTLSEAFEGRPQLILYRAFFEPGVHGWPDHACVGCSMVADHVADLAHLNARDTTLAFVSRAPQPDIARLKKRMGWNMPWYTITDHFDRDFDVEEYHGHNAFIRVDDEVFRTYFINERGDEAMGTTWSYLDMTALGRQERWEEAPPRTPQSEPYQWWRWHDSYTT